MAIDKKKGLPAAAELRRFAEKQVQGTGSEGRGTSQSGDETSRLLHELQVHQIELELQNAELRQARDEVETVLGNYTDLYDFAPVGYVTLDFAGVIRAANLTAARLLGMERSRLPGRNIARFVVNETRPHFAAFLDKVFSSQGKESCEQALTTTGSAPLFVQIEAVVSASGQECRAVLIDISERRLMEEKLSILRRDLDTRVDELAAANLELEAFNYSVSHDLHRPLTVINGYCQVLRDLCRNQLDAESLNYINEIYEGSLKMNRLINTLLHFSCVTRVEMSGHKVDLSKIVEDIARGLTTAEPDRLVTFEITPGIFASCDADLLKILFKNLLGNAWKYSGSVEKTVIEFGVTEQEGKPVFFVRDNGPGFEMAMADKLFIPFQRLPGTGVEGHGIGLATVERIVKRHGGRVWAESGEGRGATFFFTLE
ncbi:MAG: ATP-binding protein [Desulfuromonadales bacterium]|nr:ATP-binding protein [Desulfuromonadales bacterium]